MFFLKLILFFTIKSTRWKHFTAPKLTNNAVFCWYSVYFTFWNYSGIYTYVCALQLDREWLELQPTARRQSCELPHRWGDVGLLSACPERSSSPLRQFSSYMTTDIIHGVHGFRFSLDTSVYVRCLPLTWYLYKGDKSNREEPMWTKPRIEKALPTLLQKHKLTQLEISKPPGCSETWD